MKILNYLLSFGILLGLLVAAGCSDDDAPPEPDPIQERIDAISNSSTATYIFSAPLHL